MFENEVLLLQGDPPIFDAHIPEVLTAVTGVDADDVSAILRVQLVDAGNGHRSGGRRRRLRPGRRRWRQRVSPSAWGAQSRSGTGVGVGGGAANRWLPSRAPTMSAAIPSEMSRIMAPRATSSCRLCRQFILPSALDPDLGNYAHRANSGVSRGHVIRGGIPPSLAVSAAWHKSELILESPGTLSQVLTGLRPVDTIRRTSTAEVRRTLASAIATAQNQDSGAQLRPRGLATQDPRLSGCIDASGNDGDPLKEETTMRRRLLSIFVILAVIATMLSDSR